MNADRDRKTLNAMRLLLAPVQSSLLENTTLINSQLNQLSLQLNNTTSYLNQRIDTSDQLTYQVQSALNSEKDEAYPNSLKSEIVKKDQTKAASNDFVIDTTISPNSVWVGLNYTYRVNQTLVFNHSPTEYFYAQVKDYDPTVGDLIFGITKSYGTPGTYTGWDISVGSELISDRYGSTANTICEGNDSRLSNARTPTAHTHVMSDVKEYNYTRHAHESGSNSITSQSDFVAFNDFVANNHSSSIPNGPWLAVNANGGTFIISTGQTVAFGFDACNGVLGFSTGTTNNATGYSSTTLQANLLPGIPTPSNGFITKYEIECRLRTDTDVITQNTITKVGFADIFTNVTPTDGVYIERIYNGTVNETTFKVVFRNGGAEERIDTAVAFSANTTYRVYLSVERNTSGVFTTTWEIVNDTTGTTSTGTATPTNTARYPSASTDYLNAGVSISKTGATTTTARVLLVDYIGVRIRRPLRRGMKLFS